MKISVKKIICIAGIVLAAAVIIIIIISIVSYSTLQSKPIAYDIPEAGEIHIKKDIVYKNTGKRDLMMDLYLPANIPGEKKPPVIVMVHGDSITAISPNPKNWGIFSSYGTLFAKKGYAGAAFTHRMLDMLPGFDINADKIYEKFIHIESDIKDCITYLRNNALQYNIDPDRICLWVFSAGGPYGLSWLFKENPGYIRCVVSFYSLLDIKSYFTNARERIIHSFSPAFLLSTAKGNIPAFFIARAAKDQQGITDSTFHFTEQAGKKGVKVILETHEKGIHGFDALVDDERTREIIDLSLTFLKNNL